MHKVTTVETRKLVRDCLAMAYGYRAIARQDGISGKKRAESYFKARRVLRTVRELLS